MGEEEGWVGVGGRGLMGWGRGGVGMGSSHLGLGADLGVHPSHLVLCDVHGRRIVQIMEELAALSHHRVTPYHDVFLAASRRDSRLELGSDLHREQSRS